MKYLNARWGEISTVLSASGAAGIVAAYLLGQVTGKQAAAGIVAALVGYLLPDTKAAPKV